MVFACCCMAFFLVPVCGARSITLLLQSLLDAESAGGILQEAEDVLQQAGLPYDWHLPSRPENDLPAPAPFGAGFPVSKCACHKSVRWVALPL